MSRLLRSLLAATLIAVLFAGAALAGPGWNWSGDPEIPEIANPRSPMLAHEPLESQANAVRSGLVDADDRPEPVRRPTWHAAYMVYLRLVRIVSF